MTPIVFIGGELDGMAFEMDRCPQVVRASQDWYYLDVDRYRLHTPGTTLADVQCVKCNGLMRRYDAAMPPTCNDCYGARPALSYCGNPNDTDEAAPWLQSYRKARLVPL